MHAAFIFFSPYIFLLLFVHYNSTATSFSAVCSAVVVLFLEIDFFTLSHSAAGIEDIRRYSRRNKAVAVVVVVAEGNEVSLSSSSALFFFRYLLRNFESKRKWGRRRLPPRAEEVGKKQSRERAIDNKMGVYWTEKENKGN